MIHMGAHFQVDCLFGIGGAYIMFRIHEMEKQGEHVLEGSGLGGQRVEIGDVSVQAVDCTDQFILRNLETGGGSACAFHGNFRILGEAAETYETPCPSGDCIQREHIFRHPGIAGAQNGVASCRFLDLFLTVDTVLPCPGKILDFLADLAVVIIIS